jgi:hypothetical protein
MAYSPHAAAVILLGQIAARLRMLELACNRCDRRGRLSTARLVAEYGADMPGPDLLRILSADCPSRDTDSVYDRCGVHMPELPSVLYRLR